MATWEWMSMVELFGLTSRPGLPYLRAAVASYLFHCVAISASFLLSPRDAGPAGAVVRLYDLIRKICNLSGSCSLKHAQVLGDNGIVQLDATGGAAKHHPAGIDDDDVV